MLGSNLGEGQIFFISLFFPPLFPFFPFIHNTQYTPNQGSRDPKEALLFTGRSQLKSPIH